MMRALEAKHNHHGGRRWGRSRAEPRRCGGRKAAAALRDAVLQGACRYVINSQRQYPLLQEAHAYANPIPRDNLPTVRSVEPPLLPSLVSGPSTASAASAGGWPCAVGIRSLVIQRSDGVGGHRWAPDHLPHRARGLSTLVPPVAVPDTPVHTGDPGHSGCGGSAGHAPCLGARRGHRHLS